jgi:O-antigen/teichoic acid export membrane protein
MLRNALNHLAGALVPAVVMFVTVPIILKGLGSAQYGLLVILGSVTGYLAVFDINLTASSVKFLSDAKARGQSLRVMQVLSFSLSFYAAIGFVGALCLYAFADPLVAWLVDPGLYDLAAARTVMRVSALGFALAQLYTFALSIPQALQRYDVSARVEVLNGSLVPLATAGVVLLGADLLGVVWVRNLGSLLAVLALAFVARALLPGLRLHWPDAALRREMLGFSAFAYLNRLASLSYQHSDKIVIAAVLDVKQVAFYTVPVVLANRIMGMSYRLTEVIFPNSSALFALGRGDEVRRLMQTNMRYVFALNAMAVVALILLGDGFLRLWIGEEFARQGAPILALIALGVLVDSITNAPALVTDGSGRPRVTGSFAVLRAVVGLLGLYAGAVLDGTRGVAASHLLTSCLFSALFLAYFTRRVFPMPLATLAKAALLPGTGVGLAGLLVGFGLRQLLPADTAGTLLGAAGGIAVMVALLLWRVVSPDHRQALRVRLARQGMRS